jgi:DNA-binding NarL/FixJ family response regulator
VVAALADASRLDETADQTAPDLCILDVRLPPTWTDEGIRAALALRSRHPALGLLVLSQYVEERYAADLIAASAGSLGYLLKDRVADVSDFLEAVDRIAAGATVLDPEVVAQLLSRRARDTRMQRLTDREASVLALIAEGRSNQAIARTLHVSEGSVEKHITAVFQKLGLEPDESGNRRVLAALAHIEHGGIPPQTGADR